MSVLVSLMPSLVSVAPGDVATCTVRVRNTGEVVDEFSVTVVGDAAAWATVDPTALRLFPGAEESATIRFAPPLDAAVPAGQVPFGVRVTPQEDHDASVVEEGAIAVASYTNVGAEMVPRNAEGRSGATFTVTVQNNGNAPAAADLAVEDPDNLLAFDLDPPSLTLDAGGRAVAKLQVRPSGRAGKAQRRYGFRLVVSPQGGPPVLIDGAYTQRRKRRVLPLAIAAAVLLVVVVAAAAFLRPKVESTAQEIKRISAQIDAAKDAVADAEKQIEEAKQEAATAQEKVDDAGAAVDKAAETAGGAGLTTTTVAGSESPGGGDTATTAPATTETTAVAAGSLSGDKPFGTSTETYTCTMAAHASETGTDSGKSSTTTQRASTTTEA